MKKYIFWGIVLFVISLCIGYFYGQRFFSGTALVEEKNIQSKDNIIKNNVDIDTVIETNNVEVKILPSTNFGLRKKYKVCNHMSFEFVDLPVELVNKNREEVEKLYEEWDVEEFFENKVVLYKEVEGICEEHFFITVGEDFIEIYKFIDENNNKVLYYTTDISKEYLAKEDIIKLEKGITLFGKDKLNSVIEDFE